MEIIAPIFLYIVEQLANFGYWGIGMGMALESACIPLPSEIVLPFAGYLIAKGEITFLEAFLAATTGTLVGSLVAYHIGRWGGYPFIKTYGRYIFISEKEFARVQTWFAKKGQITIFLSRMLPVVRTFISLPAGIAQMDQRKFVFYSLLGSVPWNFLFIFLGFQLGNHWDAIYNNFHQLDYVIIGAIISLVIFYKLRKK